MTFKEKYFHAVAIAVSVGFLSGLAGVAHAEQAVTAETRDVYRTVTRQIPHTETHCYEVEVPIYGQVGTGPKAEDIIGGAIIGGIIGNNIKGEENGGAAGAVIGGLLGSTRGNKEGVIGYRKEDRCEKKTTYSTESKEVYSHSEVTFYDNGRRYTLKYNK